MKLTLQVPVREVANLRADLERGISIDGKHASLKMLDWSESELTGVAHVEFRECISGNSGDYWLKHEARVWIEVIP